MPTDKSKSALLAQIEEAPARGARARKTLHRLNRADFAANTAEKKPNQPRVLGVGVRDSGAVWGETGQPVQLKGDFQPPRNEKSEEAEEPAAED